MVYFVEKARRHLKHYREVDYMPQGIKEEILFAYGILDNPCTGPRRLERTRVRLIILKSSQELNDHPNRSQLRMEITDLIKEIGFRLENIEI